MANEQNKYAGISTLRTFLSQLKNLFITKTDANTALSGKADKAHNHDSDYDAKGSASAVQENLDVVSDALDAHTGDSNVHVTATNKSNWNSAHTHSTSTHARVDATKVADSTTNGNILINGTETNVYSHPNSGVTAGTYKSVTVNAQGHITSGSNPTTLSGYGITDAEAKGAASAALASAKEYADTVASGKADANHNHDSAYDTKGSANSALASAKTYADSAATTAANKVKNDLLNGAGTAYDTLKELGDLIDANQDAIDALETVASGKADKTHGHAISDISGLQSALDGKAASSHGTHVSYSSTAPVMDGAASVGSASTVARSDHKHPTDTSRAAKTDLDSHTGNTTVHITSTERSNWNAAKTHADSAHAPSNAQPNQNAFSNIKVGSTTIAADTTTDTLELVGSNVTITPDATNDKVTISVADASTGTKGIVQLTNSTASTSTTTAATPNSVKLVADLASTAKKNADAAQTRADSAYALAESKVDSLSDLGITATATELNYMDGVTSNVQTQLDSKLSTSGGTMTGEITLTQSNLVKRDKDTSSVSIYGGTESGNGATVTVYGKEQAIYAGRFALKANNGESSATLEGIPDGTLRWNGKNVVALGTSEVIPISSGGTGAANASDALSNLGGVPKTNPTLTGSFSMNKLYSSTTGSCSFVEGYNGSATGNYGAHSEGYYTEANGDRSHAEGDGSVANGIGSHAEGQKTIASCDYQHVQGKYNVEDSNNAYAHIVGNGSSNTARSNAHTVDWDGNAWFAGDIYFGGTSQDDANSLSEQVDTLINNIDNLVYISETNQETATVPLNADTLDGKNPSAFMQYADATDYIVEQGTSGSWTYRKWNSGIAECWGTHKNIVVQGTATYGSIIYAGYGSVYLPSIFTEVTNVNQSCFVTTGYDWCGKVMVSGVSSLTLYPMSGSAISTGSKFTAYIHVHGRWK